jgi:cell division protein FtsL
MTRAIHGFGWTLRRRETVNAMPLKNQLLIGALVVLLLMSAFSVIYLKDLSRRMFIRYQHLQQVQQNDEVEWSKLLLEEGAWSTQARIQNIASTQLNMVMPAMKNIVMIETRHATLPSS